MKISKNKSISMHTKKRTRHVMAAYMVAAAAFAGASIATAADLSDRDFDDLTERVQSDPGSVTAADVVTLLKAGEQLNRPVASHLAAKRFLSRHATPQPELLRLAADAAMRAGDARTAVARLKALLASTEPTAETSQAAGDLYRLLIDQLNEADDAYAAMSEFGSKFRADDAARRFDSWFLAQAQERNDYVAWAQRLAVILQEKHPLEAERLLVWDDLDVLMTSLSRGRRNQAEALAWAEKIPALVRGDARRQHAYRLYVARLAFMAGSAGKSESDRAAAFTSVLSAAKTYFDASPDGATLRDILTVFYGGHGGVNPGDRDLRRDDKRAFFVAAFDRIDDAGRRDLIAWQEGPLVMADWIADPGDWAELGRRHPALFLGRTESTLVKFDVDADDVNAYSTQAAFLKSTPTEDAAIIGALAAGGGDPDKTFAVLADSESWRLPLNRVDDLLIGELWPRLRRMGKAASDDALAAHFLKVGDEKLAGSPVFAADLEAAGRYVTFAWRAAPGAEKQFTERLKRLAWIPWDQRQRGEVYTSAYNDFKRWADRARREAAAGNAEAKARLEQISLIESAFQAALDPAATVAKAPTPVAQAFAAAMQARQTGNAAAVKSSLGALYQQVAAWPNPSASFGRGIIEWILAAPTRDGDVAEIELKIIGDRLAQMKPGRDNWDAALVVDRFMSVRPTWRWAAVPEMDQQAVKSLNAVFTAALDKQVDAGWFSPQLFDWFRLTRHGNKWSDWKLGQNTFAKMLDKQLLLTSTWRYPHESAAASSMWLVLNRFPHLKDRFPPESAFDSLMVKEAQQTGVFDWSYWNYGRDRKREVVNAAATAFAAYQTLPFGYGQNTAPTYARQNFWRWQQRALGAEPAVRDKMIAAMSAAFGKTRFDGYAMGRSNFDLIARASRPDERKTFFDTLATYQTRLAGVDARGEAVQLRALATIPVDRQPLTEAEVNLLLAHIHDNPVVRYAPGHGYETLAVLLYDALLKAGRRDDIFDVTAEIWRISGDVDSVNLQRQMATYASTALEAEDVELAAVLTDSGLTLLAAKMTDDVRTSMSNTRANALVKVGAMIPVPRSDPRYPIYESQADYLLGRLDTAWEKYATRAALAEANLRDLDPGYVTWLIERNAEARRFDAAESLAQQMIRTIDATPAGFDAERRAGVLLAYARIAEVRQEFAKARAQYERIAAASEFAGSRAQLIGQLRMANIDRVTEQYDQAIIQLDKLTHEEDMMVQAEAYFGLAQLFHDQEQLAEASENLEEVFTRSPSHAAARILKGRIDLGMKRLEEATLVKVGIAGDRKIIVPGRPLRVELEDRNLAVAGAAESIQVRVWTSQGDDEIFSLYPRGDSRTRFEGEIASEVAPMAVGDSVLQLLGSDTVWFSYSTGLEAKPSQEQPAGELTVVTDAELYASSGEILSKEQLEEQQIEESIRRQLQMNAGYEERLALSTRRPSDEVKPGNPVNVRVVDLDQSSTAAPDRLIVRVAAASGDSLEQVALVETDTHSGVFEGSFTTSAGQAMAYASDSQEGRDPNFAISSGDYPAWVALPDNQKPKTFSVDLNDNVSLGKMRILADTPGRKLKSFLLQTSLNGRDFATIGSWPRKFEAWDGGLRAEVVGLPTGKAPATIREYQTQLDTGYLTAGTGRAVLPIDSMAVNFPTLRGLATKGVRLRQNDWTLGRVSGYIDIERPQLRTFEIRMTDEDSATTCILVIDGEPAERGTLDRRRLSRGVHRIDIYFASPASEKGGFVLHMTDPENPRLRPASADAFDPAKHPAIVEAAKAPTARIDSDQTGQVFDVTFSAQAQARILRLLIADYETDAPSISEITLLNGKGEKVLPASEDFMKLRQNSTLEITPGDEITISYRDSRSLTKSTESREAYMHATYSDAEVSAAFIKADYESGGERKIEYIPLRRFVPGDAVKVFIKDPDGDVSDEADVLEFDAMTSDGTRVSLRARESDRHSGVFMGDVFPVSGEPKRDTELQVREGDDLTISYLDQENTDPGIAWTRQFLVEQVWHTTPELRVFAAVTSAADGSGMTDDGLAPEQRVLEFTPVERMVTLKRPEAPAGVDEVTPVLVDGPLIVELTYPSIAKSPASEAELFIQTEAGRQLHQANIGGVGDTDAMPFDVNVPGTIRMTRVPEEAAAGDTPPGYRSPLIEGNPYAAEPVDEGRFTFVVPMEMATPPQKSLAFEVDEEKQRGRLEEPKLAIRGGDRVYVGYRYTNEAGEVTWIQQKVQLTSDPFFHVMDRRYQLQISETHIGETLYFRVIDKKFDATDEKDQLTVKLSATSGAAMDVDVIETFPHSGIFRGYVRLAYRGETLGATEQNVFQVDYGDVVTAVYQRDGETVTREIDVFKGADGHVLPFTKRFADPEKAVQTQFTIAEAYFELAKRHRELATAAKDDPARQRQLESLVRREIAQGKKLLEEALRDFPNTESRAQAEYLLANLSYEFANDANNDQTKRRHNLEAINRFSDIVARFPDSPYAPRSQFKKALVLEQMGEIDKACEEYVKLSYRYPENELVAETIARLGQYFLTKGKDFETSAAAAADDPVEAEKIRLRSRDMFRTAAEVFGRLGVRFPDHGLAQKTKVLSGQCYMRAEDFKKAIEVFTDIFESEGANPQLASESMYWAGDCYMRLMSYTDAYRTFKKLTWDYPESQWARFARGRLTDDHLLSAAEQDVEN